MGKEIILYTIDCPKCKILERKLTEAKIIFDVVKDREVLKEKGYLSLPVLEVDGVSFDFLRAINWIKEQI